MTYTVNTYNTSGIIAGCYYVSYNSEAAYIGLRHGKLNQYSMPNVFESTVVENVICPLRLILQYAGS